ncbi:DUF2057 family protein [Vibrio algivorus]|uniref:UPF0319 protein FOF44_09330 n=1 Tax=Vibrio algivorus TaxID=1667024 RepID=A0A557P6R6_9VIBR|nr:DUF2057 family protein [Vibrio algivorus]TVO36339.1 DUF2057 domain-containing protein [Vibrio algivorus]
MIRKFFISLGAISVFVSQLAYADLKVVIPNSIDLLVVNGLKPEVKSGGLFSSDSLILPDGENQIVFKFEPSVEDGDTMRKVYSDVIVAKINESNKELKFKLPEYEDLTQARKEIQHFTWSLVDDKEQDIVIKEDILDSKGVQLGRNFIEDVMDYNMRGGVAAITTGSVVAKSLPMNTQTKPDSENVSQLKAWYLKANEQERKDFQIWLIDQK